MWRGGAGKGGVWRRQTVDEPGDVAFRGGREVQQRSDMDAGK